MRFRAAIKEPEELSYLFLAIALGLGFGADQRMITVLAFALIGALIVVLGLRRGEREGENLHFTVTSEGPDRVSLGRIVEVLREHCGGVDLKRYDESDTALEASFLVEFRDVSQLEASQSALRALSDSIRISFLDVKGVT